MGTIKEVEARVESLEDKVEVLDGRLKLVEGAKDGKVAPADDDELDSPYGDPRVFYDPKDWIKEGNPSRKNYNFSACEPEFLDRLAGFLAWQSKQNERQAENPTEAAKWGGRDKLLAKSRFQKIDAARALGWAKRLRSGWQPDQDVAKQKADESEFAS